MQTIFFAQLARDCEKPDDELSFLPDGKIMKNGLLSRKTFVQVNKK